MSFPIQPENNRLLVKELKKPNLTKIGSLYVGEMADLSFGEVVAAAEATKYEAGVIVGYPNKAGVGQYVNGGIYLWLRADEIWGTWDKNDWEKLSSENE